MRDDARFAHLVQRRATDDELTQYLRAKKNGEDWRAPWEDGGDDEPPPGGEGEEGADDYAAVARRTRVARMRELEEKALKAEIERRKMEGTLISVEAVAAEYGRAMTTLKNTVMAIGPSIRGELMELVAEPTAATQVEAIIVERCRDALEAAADSLL